MTMKVIDVSRYQEDIDWKKVKADGVDGAIIRGGYSNNDGSITIDKKFYRNMEGAAAAGVPVGVYIYSYSKTVDSAVKAARAALDLVEPYRLEFPLVWDYEDSYATKLSRATNTAICKAVMQIWEKAGYYAMLYSYKNFVENYLDMADLAAFDFWLAHYTKKSNYKGPYGMWQYSHTGRVSGISGDVDLNEAYKDYPAIIKKAGLNKLAVVKYKTLKVGPMTAAAAEKIKATADELGVDCAEV